jgi:hypothetical protein
MSSRMPAAYSVDITPAAERDVEEIWAYIMRIIHGARLLDSTYFEQ